MTVEEAIILMNEVKGFADFQPFTEYQEAFDIAITALKEQAENQFTADDAISNLNELIEAYEQTKHDPKLMKDTNTAYVSFVKGQCDRKTKALRMAVDALSKTRCE